MRACLHAQVRFDEEDTWHALGANAAAVVWLMTRSLAELPSLEFVVEQLKRADSAAVFPQLELWIRLVIGLASVCIECVKERRGAREAAAIRARAVADGGDGGDDDADAAGAALAAELAALGAGVATIAWAVQERQWDRLVAAVDGNSELKLPPYQRELLTTRTRAVPLALRQGAGAE